jgi:riboflavin synthase
MFTGIIEELGEVFSLERHGTNLNLIIKAKIASELKVDQSVAHNGVCLTVVDVEYNQYTVTAIKETLTKTNLGKLRIADKVNLERCMKLGGRLDGHIVQGHVDTTAECLDVKEENGSWVYTFQYHKKSRSEDTVEKGSISINGVSLTVVDSRENSFSVCIIPYTYEHTNFNSLSPGDKVNLEFDIVGKYIAKMIGE